MRVHTLCVLFIVVVVVQWTVASPVAVRPRNAPPCGATDDFFAPGPDCGSFYACRYGVVDLLPCPEGTLWDRVNNRCDWEENVNCSDDVTTAPPITEPPTAPPTTVDPPVTNPPVNPTPTGTPPPITFMPDVEGALPILFPGTDCPEGERAFAVHEFDCRRYFYCLYGVRYLQTCPFLQKFDFLRGHCVPETDEELRCFNDL